MSEEAKNCNNFGALKHNLSLIILFSLMITIFSCKRKVLSQQELAKWYIYQSAFQKNNELHGFVKCDIKDIYNYDIKSISTKKKHDSTEYVFFIFTKNNENLYDTGICSYIYKIGFIGASPLIRYTQCCDGIIHSIPTYTHFLKDPKNYIYRGLKAEFINKTLKQDSVYFQKIDPLFVGAILKNRNTANKWLIELAEELN